MSFSYAYIITAKKGGNRCFGKMACVQSNDDNTGGQIREDVTDGH